MSALRTTLKNTVVLAAGDLFSKFVYFVYLAVLARQLSQESFGEFTTIITLIAFMSILADFGISHVVIRELAGDRTRLAEVFLNAFLITLGLSLAASGLMTIFAFVGNYPYSMQPLIVLAGLGVLGNTATTTACSVFRGVERMEIPAILTGVLLLMSSVAGIAASFAVGGIAIQVGISVFFSLAGAVLALGLVRRYSPGMTWGFDKALCRTLFRQALPIFSLMVLSVMLHWADVLILGQVNTMREVAIYGASIRIVDVAGILSLSAGAALFPTLSAKWKESADAAKQIYTQHLRFFAAFALGVAAGMSVLAEAIAIAVFGVEYAEMATPLRILAWAFFFTTVNGPIGMLLIAANTRYRQFMPLFVSAVAGNIMLNVFLAPRWGAIGAAVAFILTAISTFMIRQKIAKAFFQTPPSLVDFLWRPAIAALIMCFALTLMQSRSLALSIPAGCAVFAAVLGLLGEHKREPYREFAAFLGSMMQRVHR